MKKKILTILLIGLTAINGLTACSLQKTCKEDGCEETEIYKDGYCKFHYFTNTGENIIKDVINKGGK